MACSRLSWERIRRSTASQHSLQCWYASCRSWALSCWRSLSITSRKGESRLKRVLYLLAFSLFLKDLSISYRTITLSTPVWQALNLQTLWSLWSMTKCLEYRLQPTRGFQKDSWSILCRKTRLNYRVCRARLQLFCKFLFYWYFASQYSSTTSNGPFYQALQFLLWLLRATWRLVNIQACCKRGTWNSKIRESKLSLKVSTISECSKCIHGVISLDIWLKRRGSQNWLCSGSATISQLSTYQPYTSFPLFWALSCSPST